MDILDHGSSKHRLIREPKAEPPLLLAWLLEKLSVDFGQNIAVYVLCVARARCACANVAAAVGDIPFVGCVVECAWEWR